MQPFFACEKSLTTAVYSCLFTTKICCGACEASETAWELWRRTGKSKFPPADLFLRACCYPQPWERSSSLTHLVAQSTARLSLVRPGSSVIEPEMLPRKNRPVLLRSKESGFAWLGQ